MSNPTDEDLQRIIDARAGQTGDEPPPTDQTPAGQPSADQPPTDRSFQAGPAAGGDANLLRATEDIHRAFAALDRLGEVEPPEGLAEQTIARIRAARRTNELLRREELNRRRVYWPTFSIREVAAVAASLLVLATIFLPSLRLAARRADRQACLSRMGQVGTALSAYALENDGALPTAAADASRWLGAPGQSEAVASPSRGPFRLIQGQFATPTQFLCPAVGGEGFVVRSGMHDFPSARHIHYSTQYNIGPQPVRVDDPDLARHADEMAIFADASPIFDEGRFHPDRLNQPVSRNHDGTGQNVLYLDMHGEWATNASVGVGNDNIYLVDGVFDYDGDEQPKHKTDSFLLPASAGPDR